MADEDEDMDLVLGCNAGVSLINMPHEVTSGISWCLDVKDIGQAVASCRVLQEEVADPELWFHLFMRTCWPPSDTLLAFAEECTKNPASVDWRTRLCARSTAEPALVVDVGRGYTKYSIVHGIRGRSEPDGQAPTLVQLCSSPTNPPDCGRNEQLLYIHIKLDADLTLAASDPEHSLHAVAVKGAKLKVGGKVLVQGGSQPPDRAFKLVSHNQEEDTWQVQPWMPANSRGFRASLSPHSSPTSGSSNAFSVPSSQLVPVRCASELPLLVGEPFTITASRGGQEDIASTEWAHDIRHQLQGRSGPVRFAPQAQISLWAHGIDHGIVVNIGQVQTLAVAIVNGELVQGTACASNIGGSTLTMAMMRQLSERLNFVSDDLMTWCRDLKENYCYAAPPTDKHGVRKSLRERLAAGDDFGVQRIQIPSPVGYGRGMGDMIELAEERVLVPEMFFERSMGGGPTLPQLVLACAYRVQQSGRFGNEDVQRLLQQVVLVGGGADIPGLRPRTEYEMRILLREGIYPQLCETVSPEQVFVLNPPLGYSEPLTSPRFVPVVGGCVRAASALHFDKGEAQRHSIQVAIPEERQFNGRLPGWLDRRRFILAGSTVFRTGGGGGEDDEFWEFLADSRNMFANMMEESSDENDLRSDSEAELEQCPEEAEEEEEEEAERSSHPSASAAAAAADIVEPAASQARGRNRGTRGKSASDGKGGKAGNKGKSRAGTNFKGSMRPRPSGKGALSNKGKGRVKGGGKGAQQRRVWRPVNPE